MKSTLVTISTYAYDSSNQRIKLITGASTTIFATKEYNITGSSTAKYISANNIGIASVNYVTSSVMRYILNDHLGGTNLVTNASNTVIQTIDYYPYGERRINVGTDVSQREYIGQYYDEGTSLSYLQARYYDGSRGQFISQDPLFWSQNQNLSDPQSLNSYSYAIGNPITKSDPTGQSWQTFGQGIASPFVYAYNNPLQTVGFIGAGAAVAFVAPVAAAVGGAALGGWAIGTAIGNAIYAPNADTRDYYLGQGVTFTGLTAVGIKGASGLSQEGGSYSVYGGYDDAGVMRYVGRTGRDPAIRWAEHGRAIGSGRENLQYNTIQTGASAWGAHYTEQSYINTYGLQKNGGQLLNKINSSVPGGSGGGGSAYSQLQSIIAGLSALVGQLSALVSQQSNSGSR